MGISKGGTGASCLVSALIEACSHREDLVERGCLVVLPAIRDAMP